MALSDAYVTEAEYRAAIARTDAGDDAAILSDLKAVSRWLDARLGRAATGFNKDTADATRVYVVETAGRTLYIDPLSAAPTTVKVDDDGDGTFDETAITSTNYEMLPLDATLRPDPAPYDCIRLTPWGSRRDFVVGDRVQVVGKFGWPSVPDIIKRATIRFTAMVRLESPLATDRIAGEIEGVIQVDRGAKSLLYSLLDTYRSGGSYFV